MTSPSNSGANGLNSAANSTVNEATKGSASAVRQSSPVNGCHNDDYHDVSDDDDIPTKLADKVDKVKRLMGVVQVRRLPNGRREFVKPCWRCFDLGKPCIKSRFGNPGREGNSCEHCKYELGYCNAGGTIPRYLRAERLEDYLNRVLMTYKPNEPYVPVIAVPMQPAGKVTPCKPTMRATDFYPYRGTASPAPSGVGSIGRSNAAGGSLTGRLFRAGSPGASSVSSRASTPRRHFESYVPQDMDWRQADSFEGEEQLIDVLKSYKDWRAQAEMRQISALTALRKLRARRASNGNATIDAEADATVAELSGSIEEDSNVELGQAQTKALQKALHHYKSHAQTGNPNH